MPIDIDKVKAEYQAKSDLNDDAIAAFLAAYPMFSSLPASFTDTRGLDWEAEYIVAHENNVGVICRWVNDDPTTTNYYQQYSAIAFERFMFPYTYSDELTAEDAGFYYSIPELRFAEILDVQIEGLSIDPAEYAFNPDITVNNFQLLIASSAGQNMVIFYKKNPHYYGY